MNAKTNIDHENPSINNLLLELFRPIIKSTVEEVLSIHRDRPRKINDELGVHEAALLLRCSKGHIYNLTSSGELPFYKKGKHTLFNREELEDWDNARKKLSAKNPM
ncbi:MAG: helix-turn-helix domain-containing protein [Bacteroidales bacterium]|nr:helix-turn-helix domain-containing protein [Bacteroidales bacterium]